MGSRPKSTDCLLKITVIEIKYITEKLFRFLGLSIPLIVDAILNIINFSDYQLPSISIEAKIPLSDGLVSQRKYKMNIKSS